jgi:hypothetical protein
LWHFCWSKFSRDFIPQRQIFFILQEPPLPFADFSLKKSQTNPGIGDSHHNHFAIFAMQVPRVPAPNRGPPTTPAPNQGAFPAPDPATDPDRDLRALVIRINEGVPDAVPPFLARATGRPGPPGTTDTHAVPNSGELGRQVPADAAAANAPGKPGGGDDRPPGGSEASPIVAGPDLVLLAENLLLPGAIRPASPNIPSITDLAGIEEVGTLSSSRFGSVRLMRRAIEGGFEYFAAKHYNIGDNQDGVQAFQDHVRVLVSLSHPYVLPIVGLIPPTETAGPIVLTPYSTFGSLSDVLEGVRRGDPAPIWSDAGKLRMIVSLISGFQYLHDHGVVHCEVKPSDLIVQSDGSIRICGYLTRVLEEHNWTRASHAGALSYKAPEVYEDRENERRSRDPKPDVFSFALILYEILCQQPVFPPTYSAAMIMRRAISAKASDRPVIPSGLPAVLQDLIAKNWLSAASKRQTFAVMWQRLWAVGFKVFPAVEVEFVAV